MGKWCSTAPPELIRLYETHRVRNGRELLGRLLLDQNLKKTWPHLRRQVRNDREWQEVWGDIAYAKHKSSQADRAHRQGAYVGRNDMIKVYKAVAEKASDLAHHVRASDQSLDVLVDRLLPHDLKAILEAGELNDSPLWPTVAEFLDSFSVFALGLAGEAMNKPIPDQRRSGWIPERVFAFYLGTAFRNRFGNPLCGIVAKLMGATFPCSVITGPEDFVKTALRRSGVRTRPKT